MDPDTPELTPSPLTFTPEQIAEFTDDLIHSAFALLESLDQPEGPEPCQQEST